MIQLADDADAPLRGLLRIGDKLVPRRMGFARPGQLVCPHGHRLEGYKHLRVGGLRCRHRGPVRNAVPCGAMLYIVAMQSDAGRWIFVADTSVEELELWETRGFTTDQAMEWLGASLPIRSVRSRASDA